MSEYPPQQGESGGSRNIVLQNVPLTYNAPLSSNHQVVTGHYSSTPAQVTRNQQPPVAPPAGWYSSLDFYFSKCQTILVTDLFIGFLNLELVGKNSYKQ